MALDPNIILKATNQVATPSQQVSDVAAAQNNQAVAQQNTIKTQQMQQGQQDDAALRQAIQGSGGDLEKALPQIMATNPIAGLKLQDAIRQQKEALLDFHGKQAAAVAQEMGPLKGLPPEQRAQALQGVSQRLQASGVPPTGLPDPSDPDWDRKVSDIQTRSLTSQQQVEKLRKEQEDAIKADDEKRKQQATDEQARRDKAQQDFNNKRLLATEARDAERLAIERAREERLSKTGGGEDVGVAADVRTTGSGRQYVDLSKYKGKDYSAAQQQAHAMGVYGANASESDALQNIDTARQNMAEIEKSVPKLPTSSLSRLAVGPMNKIEAITQIDPDLAAWGTYRTAAIQAMRAMAGSKGLRINRSEIEAAMANDIPEITDTQATAKQKIERVNKMLDHQENGLMGNAPIQKPIPGVPGGIAESRDGGKTWKRVK
jgi:hypothetical protein